jgi:hypothetical protein
MSRVSKCVRLAGAVCSSLWFDQLKAVPLRFRGNGRGATVFLSLEQFAARFGYPHEAVPVAEWRHYDLPLLDGAGKVSARWHFETPRGLVEVSDYWWNPSDELSVRAVDNRALRWFLRYLRGRGVDVRTGGSR